MARLLSFAGGLLVVLSVVVSTSQASAVDMPGLAACEDMRAPSDSIVACTGLIESDAYQGTELAKVLAGRARAYGRLGYHELALEDHINSLKLDPSISGGHYGKAVALAGLNKKKLALKAAWAELKRIDAKNPARSKIHAFRAELLLELGDRRRALRELDRAIALTAEAPKTLAMRGRLFMTMKSYRSAVRDLYQAIELGNPDPALPMELALAQHRAGEDSVALVTLDRILDSRKDSIDALALRAEVYIALDRQEEARLDLERLQAMGGGLTFAKLAKQLATVPRPTKNRRPQAVQPSGTSN